MQKIKALFVFLNDVLLKMTWLEYLVNKLLTTIFGLNPESYLYQAVSFFIYDVIKIFILLGVLIYVTSYILSQFTPEKTKQMLSGLKGVRGSILGALLGTVTPFCSCSSIPIFIGFTKAGLPLGVTFSFLISSPLVDLASIILLASVFNWTIAIIYVVVGLVIAIIGGLLIDHLKMDRYVQSFVYDNQLVETIVIDNKTKKERHQYAVNEVKDIFRRVWVYIMIGVFIGALIHGYIPQDLILFVLGKNNPFSVLIAAVIGIPIYADIFGTLPIAEALVLKGVPLGTTLTFMMGVTALSLPSLILLSKVVKKKLLFTFLGIVSLGIIVMGYLFNMFGHYFI